MNLTWEGTCCPSSGELYDFDRRGHVLSINWRALRFWPEKTRTVHQLGSSMILTWEGTYCPSSGELYDFNRRGRAGKRYGFDLRRHVLSAIWGRAGERYGFDLRGHVLSIIWRGVLGSSVVLTWEGASCPSSGGAIWSCHREGTPCPPSGDVLGALWIWPKMLSCATFGDVLGSSMVRGIGDVVITQYVQ
jgi:hypothetical protein